MRAVKLDGAGWRMCVAIGLNAGLAIRLAARTAQDVLRPTGVVATDFTVFWTAWWMVLHGRGRALYEAAAQREAQHHLMGTLSFEGGLMAFLNPPHVALAGTPLGWLADRAGEPVAFAVWAAVSLLLLLRLDALVRSLVAAPRGLPRATVTTAILAFYPCLYSIAIGQISILLAVAALELSRALERQRPGAAAAWATVLSAKPQLLVPVLVFLAARRRWDVLARVAAIGGALIAVTAAVLGPAIWLDWLRSLRSLERFFASGTPIFMMNLRGSLTRLFGAAHADTVYAVALGAWAAAMGALALALLGRRAAGVGDGRAEQRGELGAALALGLLLCPHLFAQDAVMWIAALALYLAARRERGDDLRSFVPFALAWPILFAFAYVVDLGSGRGPRSPVDIVFVAMVAATFAMARGFLRRPPRAV